MTWSYSGNPAASDVDAVRFWLQDTDAARPLLSDEEIAYVVALALPIYDDNIAAAALCADAIIAKFAKDIAISADGVSIDVSGIGDKYRTIAEELRATYERIAGAGAEPIATGISIFDFPDFDIKPLSFGVGFTDNPRAGQQEYGQSPLYDEPDSGYWTGS